jgi:glutamate N-acetyltransferase/amino-acid N-acetyltransferase
MALVYSEDECTVAGVFTKNAFKAASVIINKQKVASGKTRAVVVNSGNANACTGAQGVVDANRACALVGELANISGDLVMNASTGIIGQLLPMDKIEAGIHESWKNLSHDGLVAASNAIITTDTVTKVSSYEVEFAGNKIKLAGMCKGSGMICPNMATMLCFVMTDASIDHSDLQRMLSDSVETSFNSLTVDGDMSTNDQVLLLANGRANCEKVAAGTELGELFELGLSFILTDLAKQVAADGEGATKYVEVRVINAESYADAKSAAMTVANSPLVKTAIFGQDPNWGRVLCAAGRSEARIIPESTSLYFGDVKIVENGEPLQVSADEARKPMLEKELTITIDLGLGKAQATAFTCDFSYDYVKINAEYHT